MRPHPALLALPLGLCACASVDPETPADPPPPAESAAVERPSMMELMQMGMPGPEHELLATLVGEWEVSSRFRMEPGGPEMTTTGTAVNSMALGGRFLEMTMTGAFLGQPFESLNMMGFDRRTGLFTSVGFDSFGTYFIEAKGTRDEETGILSMHGVDETQWGQEVFHFEFEFVDDDHFRYSVFFHEQMGTVYDPPFQMVTVDLTRAE